MLIFACLLYTSLYAQDNTGKIALIGVSVEEEDEYGNTVSKIKLTADHIQLEEMCIRDRSSAGVIGQIISAILSILDLLKDGIGPIIS